MATLIANGNASVMSRAYWTDDGEFMHVAKDSQYMTGSRTVTKQSKTGWHSGAKVYGDSTVWRNGVAYPNAHWAELQVVPVEHPYKKGVWIHPDRYNLVKQYYKYTDEGKREQAKLERGVAKATAENAASRAVSGGINKATDAISGLGKAANLEGRRISVGAQYARSKYDSEHGENGNAVGRTLATIGGAARYSAAGRAADAERRRIGAGAERARSKYDREHGENGNAIGRTAATIAGGVGASAVGRAGKAAFKALTDKFEDFKKGIEKYFTGDSAKSNRAQALSNLQTTGGEIIRQVRSAIGMLGNDEGRQQVVNNAMKGIYAGVGTVKGVAKGIANSNIGQAAISAGKKAYGAVKDGVGNALKAISNFFKGPEKKKSTVGGGGTSVAARV